MQGYRSRGGVRGWVALGQGGPGGGIGLAGGGQTPIALELMQGGGGGCVKVAGDSVVKVASAAEPGLQFGHPRPPIARLQGSIGPDRRNGWSGGRAGPLGVAFHPTPNPGIGNAGDRHAPGPLQFANGSIGQRAVIPRLIGRAQQALALEGGLQNGHAIAPLTGIEGRSAGGRLPLGPRIGRQRTRGSCLAIAANGFGQAINGVIGAVGGVGLGAGGRCVRRQGAIVAGPVGQAAIFQHHRSGPGPSRQPCRQHRSPRLQHKLTAPVFAEIWADRHGIADPGWGHRGAIGIVLGNAGGRALIGQTAIFQLHALI